MRVLVTGGAGFIGSHIVDQLIAADHDVVVLDSLHPAAHHCRPDDLDPRAEYRWNDVKDLTAVTQAVRGVDAVCHQAAMVGLGVDFGDVTGYVTENDVGTAVLLRALHDAAWSGRLVLASSMVVYGEGLARCDDHGAVRPPPRLPDALDRGQFEPTCPQCGCALVPVSVPEDSYLDPRNVYAATKLHQEHLCSAFAREHPGVTATALRYHNVYGPRMPRNTPYAGVASIFRSALERGEAPRVYEDGGQLRDFIHVRDIARANLLALTRAEPCPGAFNVATGNPRSVVEMAHELSRAFGPDVPPVAVTGAWRPGDVRHVFAAADRAAEHLDFRAEISFADGMREFATSALRL
jgi:dTDP-L-rhamnose 4-epimerase